MYLKHNKSEMRLMGVSDTGLSHFINKYKCKPKFLVDIGIHGL